MTTPTDDFPSGDDQDSADVEQQLPGDSFSPAVADFDAEDDPEGCS